MKIVRWLTIAAAAVVAVAPAAWAQAVDPGAVLDRASAAYEPVQTLSANFLQVVTNPLVGAPDTTLGKLYQQRPSYFEMRFTSPAGDRIVADGRYLWLYTPSTTPGQVIRSPIPAAGTTGPNLIGQFVDHARSRYDATFVRTDSLQDGVADVIALVPIAHDLPYDKAVIWVARADTMVRRLEITESSGQMRVIVLRDLQVNAPVPGAAFKFSVPRGVRVVTQ